RGSVDERRATDAEDAGSTPVVGSTIARGLGPRGGGGARTPEQRSGRRGAWPSLPALEAGDRWFKSTRPDHLTRRKRRCADPRRPGGFRCTSERKARRVQRPLPAYPPRQAFKRTMKSYLGWRAPLPMRKSTNPPNSCRREARLPIPNSSCSRNRAGSIAYLSWFLENSPNLIATAAVPAFRPAAWPGDPPTI